MTNKIAPAFENPNFKLERPKKVIELSIFLGQILNKIHKLNYSNRYWISLLSSYSTYCINIEPYLNQNSIKWNIPNFPINKWSPLTRKDCIKHELLRKFKESKSSTTFKDFTEKINYFDNIVYGVRCEKISEIINAKALRSPSVVFLRKRNKSKRLFLDDLASNQPSIFFQNVLINVPRSFVEYYDYLNEILPIIKAPEKKVFHREHGFGVLFDFLIPKCVEFGSKIHQYQLGAFIGETKHSVSDLIYITIDKHLTYGWRYHLKDEPFYAIRLEEFKTNYEKANSTVSRDITVLYNNVNDETRDIYFNYSSDLHNKLNRTKYLNIHLRPRGLSKIFNNSKELFFLRNFQRFKIDTGKEPIAQVVKSSRIIVHWSVPSTNFLECIFVDHPVIGILNNSEPTDIILPYYEFFIGCGVLHRNVDSLIAKLNVTDIDEWWCKVISSDEYIAFKRLFARSHGEYHQIKDHPID